MGREHQQRSRRPRLNVIGTQRVDPATGQTWWELGGDNLAAEADDELGVGLVTTMGGTYENFECVGPRGTLTGSETRWPAAGQVRGIHYEHDWVDTPDGRRGVLADDTRAPRRPGSRANPRVVFAVSVSAKGALAQRWSA